MVVNKTNAIFLQINNEEHFLTSNCLFFTSYSSFLLVISSFNFCSLALNKSFHFSASLDFCSTTFKQQQQQQQLNKQDFPHKTQSLAIKPPFNNKRKKIIISTTKITLLNFYLAIYIMQFGNIQLTNYSVS